MPIIGSFTLMQTLSVRKEHRVHDKHTQTSISAIIPQRENTFIYWQYSASESAVQFTVANVMLRQLS